MAGPGAKASDRGRFITVEGSEGAGKSTHVASLVAHLKEQGIDVLSTREPGGTPLAEDIRALLLARREEPLDGLAELLLMFAGRAQHLAQVIRPALAAGRWVVCDRFTDASFAYQGAGRAMGMEKVATLAKLVHGDLAPDLTLYLDLPREVGLARARSRGELDRFEVENDLFFDRVRRGYLELAAAEPERIRTVDASGDLDEVRVGVIAVVDAFLVRTSGQGGR
ncbi:MAG: dTMP kinase [Gammaproteobacteria bacterium]|nr:dTMP kinase [Gammaproteobacteria bacterium]